MRREWFSKTFQGTLDLKERAASGPVTPTQASAYYPYEYPFGQYPYERHR